MHACTMTARLASLQRGQLHAGSLAAVFVSAFLLQVASNATEFQKVAKAASDIEEMVLLYR